MTKAVLQVVDMIRRLANEMNVSDNPHRDKCGQIESQCMLLYDWLDLLSEEEKKTIVWKIRNR